MPPVPKPMQSNSPGWPIARGEAALHPEIRRLAGRLGRTAAVFVPLLLATARLPAQDDEWRFTSTAGWESARIFRGVELAGSSARASVEGAVDGFRLDASADAPFRSGEPSEAEINAAYRFKVSEPFAIEVGTTEYVFGRTAPGNTRQSTECEMRSTWSLPAGVAVAFEYDRDFRLRADTWQAGLHYDLALKQLGAYLELAASAGWVDGRDIRPDSPLPPVADTYAFFEAGARLPYRIGAHTVLAAEVRVSDAFGQNPGWSPIGAAGRARLSGSITVSFDF